MNIDDVKKSRAALKSYFVKNAIPTEQQFGQLMDSVLNQRDDGLVKVPGDPLSIEAAGDDTSFKKALNFYRHMSDSSPAWTVSLRPRANPTDPVTGRPGLSITDGAGNSRLTIDAATGNVGIGTVAPGEALEVAGRIKAGMLTIGPWPAGPSNYAFVGTSLLDQAHPKNYALLQQSAQAGESTPAGIGRTFVNSPVEIRFRISNTDKMVLSSTGDVGIGTLTPGAKLDVHGYMRAENLLGHRPFRIETGQSSPADWKVFQDDSVSVDVDTSAAGFTATPRYLTALHGSGLHYLTCGGTSVYTPTPQGFRIYVQLLGGGKIDPTLASHNGWYIQWIGIQS